VSASPGRARRTLARVGWLVAIACLLAAVLVGSARLLSPHADRLRPEVEGWLEERLGRPVSIGALEVLWHGWWVELAMHEVQVLAPERDRALLELERLRLLIDPAGALRAGRLQLTRLVVSGAELTLVRQRDGRLTAGGLEGAVGAERERSRRGEALARLVLAQSELELEAATVVWHDRGRDLPPRRITDVNLRTRAENGRHVLEGSVRLPAELGRRLAFGVWISGDPTSPEWSGTVELEGEGIALAALPGLERALGARAAAGRASFDLSSAWRGAKLVSARGAYRLERVALAPPAQGLRIAEAEGELALERTEPGWTVTLGEGRARTASGEWPQVEAILSVEPAADGTGSAWSGEVRFARLGDLVPALAARLPERARGALLGLGLDAKLERVRFTARHAEGALTALGVSARIEGLATRASGRLPGVSGVSGHLEADLLGGVFELERAPVTLSSPERLAAPITLVAGPASVRWVRRGSGLWFDTAGLELANEAGRATLAGRAHWPFGNRLPILELEATLPSVELEHLTRFVPIGLVRPKLAGWFERTLAGGRLREGELRYRGYGGDFPFRAGAGRFVMRGRLDDVLFEYSPRWPAVEAFAGELAIDGHRLRIEAAEGRIHGARIARGEGIIDDLRERHPRLRVEGELVGPTREGLAFLSDGPLAARYGHLAGGIEASREVRVELALDLTLPRGPRVASGHIHLRDEALRFARLNVRLDEVNGVLAFSKAGLEGEEVTARYLGEPVELDVARHPERRDVTRVRMSGLAKKDFIVRQLHAFRLFRDAADPPRVLSRVSGATPFAATLDVPLDWGKSEGSAAPLNIESTLEGLALGLPPPFDKPATRVIPFAVSTALGGAVRTVSVRYGDAAGGRFELEREAEGGYRLRRGAVVVGCASPPLPAAEGLFVGGELEILAVDRWLEVLAEEPGASPPGDNDDDPYPILRVLREVELRAGAVEAIGHRLEATHVAVARGPEDGWRVTARGKGLAGEALLPAGEGGEPARIDLEHVVIGERLPAAGARRVDPRELPPIEFSTKRLVYRDRPLGALKLSTLPRPRGLSVENLYLLAEGIELRAAGAWVVERGGHRSRLSAELHSDELGRLLAAFGHAPGAAAGGATDLRLEASWPGAPADFSLARLEGTLSVRAGEGRLVEVDPGTFGRAFGLFVISNLPRRLRLDFSDVFEKGIAYERIEGSFTLAGGNAYTEDLILESPSARIAVEGRTGLVTEDYDQVITVIPKVTSSLPLVPVWLIEKVLQRNILDKVFAYQYRVTGPWSDPQVERITLDLPPASPRDRG